MDSPARAPVSGLEPSDSQAAPTDPRFGEFAFWSLLALVGIWYAALFARQLQYGLEFDESYNLTVVENLAEGRGYASKRHTAGA